MSKTANARYTILSVDDDPRLRQALARYLVEQGFIVKQAGTGKEALHALKLGGIDLVLLDLMLGRDNGLDLAREIRSTWPAVGIIMITARDDIIDRVIGLEVGADDYITKPWNLRELLARVNSVLRRVGEHQRRDDHHPEQAVLHFEGMSLDLDRRQLVAPSGEEITLTTGEFNLLAAFATRPGHVLPRDYLLDVTNGQNWHPFDRTIDARVSRLRKKIESDPHRPQLIKAVRGVGYVFTGRVRKA